MSGDNFKKSDPKIEQGAASDEQIQELHSVLLREKSEPSEGYTPMPLFLLGFVSAMIFIVSIYFIHNRGGLTSGIHEAALIYDERFDPKVDGGETAVVEVDPLVMGKRLYTQVCAACHQVNGQGLPGAFPPLAGSDYLFKNREASIRGVKFGQQGELIVNGVTYNSVMAPMGLEDEEIADVMNFIMNSWGNASNKRSRRA